MNLPQDLISQAKQALQTQWSDTVTVKRKRKVNNVLSDVEMYKDKICHFSQASLPTQNQTSTIATTTSIFMLYVDTDVIILQGDTLVITHKNQVFEGVAGMPFNREFSNVVKVEVTKIS